MFSSVLCALSTLIASDDANGQGLVEYALLLLLVSIAMIALMAIFGPGLGNIYSSIVDSM